MSITYAHLNKASGRASGKATVTNGRILRCHLSEMRKALPARLADREEKATAVAADPIDLPHLQKPV